MNEIIVLKFGGSSVADYDAMCRCAKIILSTDSPKVIVVSASGKTTRKLLSLADSRLSLKESNDVFLEIVNHHCAIAMQMHESEKITKKLHNLFEEISITSSRFKKEFRKEWLDELLSYGEYLSSLLFSQILNENLTDKFYNVELLDAKKVIKTDSNFCKANPNLYLIAESVKEMLLPIFKKSNDSIVVTQGFIGENPEGLTTTLGFDGSDYTAALLAEALCCNHFEIWKDVSGIYTMDPRIIPEACKIPTLGHHEAMALTNAGASVLHPSTLLPAMRKKMKIFIGSSIYKSEGTWIINKSGIAPKVCAIAYKSDLFILRIHRDNVLHTNALLIDVLKIFSDLNVEFNFLSVSSGTISCVICQSSTEKIDQHFMDNLVDRLAVIGEIEFKFGLSSVTVVGNRLEEVLDTNKLVSDIFKIFQVDQVFCGANRDNINFIISNDQVLPLVKMLHILLFGEEK